VPLVVSRSLSSSLWTPCLHALRPTNPLTTSARKSCTESPPMNRPGDAVTVSYARALRVCLRVHACCKRGVPHAEYRDRLSRINATRAAAASGLWTGWQQSTGSVLYLRISHSRRTCERARARSLARPLVRCAACRFCTPAISPRPGGPIFFSSSPDIRSYVRTTHLLCTSPDASRPEDAASERARFSDCSQAQGRTEGREKGPSARVNLRFADIPRMDRSNRSIDRSIALLPARRALPISRKRAHLAAAWDLLVAERGRGKVCSSYLHFRP